MEIAKFGSPIELAKLQVRGIPLASIGATAKMYGVSETMVRDLADLNTSTFYRLRKERRKLSRDYSETVTRLIHLHARASEVLPNPNKWFHTKNPHLEDQTPMELARTEAGGRAVESLLERLEYGSVA